MIKKLFIPLLMIILGLIQAFAFDIPFYSEQAHFAGLLSILSLVGFLSIIISDKYQPKQTFKLGYLYGLAYLGLGLSWVYISMNKFGGASLLFSTLANAGVVAYLALYWGLVAYLINRLGRNKTQKLLIAPAIISLLEWVRSFFLIGFPWLSLGYAQVDSWLGSFASIGGVFFVSFIAISLACAILFIIHQTTTKYKSIAGFYIIFILGLAFFIHHSSQQSVDTTEKPTNIALIQGNVDVITEYKTKQMTASVIRYLELTEKTIEQTKNTANQPDLIVWPETALPYFYSQVQDEFKYLLQKQKQYHFDFITGIPYANLETKDIYNSVAFQSKENNDNDQQATQFYYKQHLLPFGEYLPLRQLFNFFRDYVNIPMADFSRGKVIQKPFYSNQLNFSPSICFEIVFGDEIRQNAKRADVLLNISNDAWFGRSKAQKQHLNIARMRAIENQKYIIRSTNNGISAIINQSGEVTKTIEPFNAAVLLGQIYRNNKQTFYTQYGDKPWLILFTLVLVAVPLFKRQLRPNT